MARQQMAEVGPARHQALVLTALVQQATHSLILAHLDTNAKFCSTTELFSVVNLISENFLG